MAREVPSTYIKPTPPPKKPARWSALALCLALVALAIAAIPYHLNESNTLSLFLSRAAGSLSLIIAIIGQLREKQTGLTFTTICCAIAAMNYKHLILGLPFGIAAIIGITLLLLQIYDIKERF